MPPLSNRYEKWMAGGVYATALMFWAFAPHEALAQFGLPGPAVENTHSFVDVVAERGLQKPVIIPSSFIAARTVQVWLPPDYSEANGPYPVIYMHDGQGSYDRPDASFGQGWRTNRTLAKLILSGEVRPAIVVAIWNTPERRSEYMPEKAAMNTGAPSFPMNTSDGMSLKSANIKSDEYLKYIVLELKPYIDRTYYTSLKPADTMLMGSSMGGLISLYGISEYPDVFGAAACLSTHWPVGNGVMLTYMKDHLPAPESHRLYFDHGSEGLDSTYAPFQSEADKLLIAAGYKAGAGWTTRVFPGASHNEASWAERLDIPLRFLLARPK